MNVKWNKELYINKRLNKARRYIRIINIYEPNHRSPKYMKQILTELKGRTDGSTLIVGDFNNPLTILKRITRQKISKEVDNTINQLDITDIHRTFCPRQNTNSSQVYMGHFLG